MKYLLAFLVGILLGAAAAGALVFFNPLIAGSTDARPPAGWTLGYEFPEPSSLLLSHNEQLGLPAIPPDVPLLWESGIKGTVLDVLRLADPDAEAPVLATRVSVPSAAANLVVAGAVVDDYWLVTAPGRGSLFVHGVSNDWPLLRDTVVKVDWLGRDFGNAAAYTPTVGPLGGDGALTGLTGQFAAARGRAFERLEVDRYRGRFEGVRGELSLLLDDPLD